MFKKEAGQAVAVDEFDPVLVSEFSCGSRKARGCEVQLSISLVVRKSHANELLDVSRPHEVSRCITLALNSDGLARWVRGSDVDAEVASTTNTPDAFEAHVAQEVAHRQLKASRRQCEHLFKCSNSHRQRWLWRKGLAKPL
jgi:hypothetical protein